MEFTYGTTEPQRLKQQTSETTDLKAVTDDTLLSSDLKVKLVKELL